MTDTTDTPAAIQAYFIKKVTTASGAIRFTFEVDEGAATLADNIMGMPNPGKTRIYTIEPYIDKPSMFYKTEQSAEETA